MASIDQTKHQDGGRPPTAAAREPSFLGRSSELELIEARPTGTALLCLYGDAGAGKTRLLKKAEQRLKGPRTQVIRVSLAECETPADAGYVIGRELGRRTTWFRLPQFMRVHQQYVEQWSAMKDHELPARLGRRDPLSETLTARLLRLSIRNGKHAIRWPGAREARRALRDLASDNRRGLLSDLRDHLDGLARLAPVTLARDLRNIIRHRRRGHRLFLLLDDHTSYTRLAAARSQDFVWVLAKELYERGVAVTIVIARTTPLIPPGGDWQLIDSNDAPQSDLLTQRELPQFEDGHAREALAELGIEERVSEIVADAEGNIGALLDRVRTDSADPAAKLRTPSGQGTQPPADQEAHFEFELARLLTLTATAPRRSLDGLFALGDESLRQDRIARCQKILDGLNGLNGLDDAGEVRALLLKSKLFSDLHGFEASMGLLELATASRPPIHVRFDSQIAAIMFEQAKLDRLRGRYDLALERYLKLEEEALTATRVDETVVTHCNWQMAIVYARLHDLPAARQRAQSALAGFRLLLARGEDAAEAEARKLVMRKVHLKPAHVQRLFANLLRIGGDYVQAHQRLDAADHVYRVEDELRSLAYSSVTRSHMLRAEGRLVEAIDHAVAVRASYENGNEPDERLRRHALHAEVMARVANGEAPREDAEILSDTDFDIYPGARTAGLLALAEMDRAAQRWTNAMANYEQARQAAEQANNRVDSCAALIGMLECYRAEPALVNRWPTDSLRLLDELLAEPRLEHIPALGVRVELQSAFWRPSTRAEALDRAASIAAERFQRRPDDVRIEETLVEDFRAGVDGDRPIPALQLGYL